MVRIILHQAGLIWKVEGLRGRVGARTSRILSVRSRCIQVIPANGLQPKMGKLNTKRETGPAIGRISRDEAAGLGSRSHGS